MEWSVSCRHYPSHTCLNALVTPLNQTPLSSHLNPAPPYHLKMPDIKVMRPLVTIYLQSVTENLPPLHTVGLHKRARSCSYFLNESIFYSLSLRIIGFKSLDHWPSLFYHYFYLTHNIDGWWRLNLFLFPSATILQLE